MDSSNFAIRKKARPAAGADPLIALRLPSQLIASLDKWAKRQKSPSRSAAIRELLEQALGHAAPRGRRDQGSTAKASSMARQEMEWVTKDDATPADEQERRKRRLLKGPREFRDIRSDADHQRAKGK
jgi:Arc/MetJ-type ribon-helix-helix transcriptional regulator